MGSGSAPGRTLNRRETHPEDRRRIRRRRDARALLSHAQLQNVYAAVPVGLCFLDPELRYIDVNPRLAAIHGVSVSACLGRSVREVLPSLADKLEPILRTVLEVNEPALNLELPGVTDGGKLPGTCLASFYPVSDLRGRIRGINAVVLDVTDRRRTDAALRQAHESLQEREEFLRAIGDRLPSALVYRAVHEADGSFRFTHIGSGLEQVIGITREHLLANPMALLEVVDEEDRPRLLAAIATSLETLSPLDEICRIRWPGGLQRWFHFRSSVRRLPDGCIACEGLALDITERKRSEQELAEIQARNQAILSAIPDMMFVMSREGTYLDVHVRDPRTLLLPPEQFIGRNMRDVLPPDLAQQFASCVERVVASTESAVLEYSLPLDGMRRLFEARIVTCGPDRILSIVRDVTDSRRAQSEAQQNRLELARAARLTMLGEIAVSLAHELNQPLAAIVNNAQAAERFIATDRMDAVGVRDILGDIAEDGKRAGEVIRRMRAWLQRDTAASQDIDVNNVIRDVEHLIRSEVIIRHVRLATELAGDLPSVRADRVQLQQVILNLVLNAIEAMQERPPAERLLLVQSARNGDDVQVAVRDSGTGISPDHMDRLFDPFFTTRATGLGMGLRICASIVQTCGGRIWAENNADAGTTFVFTLPCARSHA